MRSTCYGCGKIHSCQRFSKRKISVGVPRAGDGKGIPHFLAIENFLDLGDQSPFLSKSKLGVRERQEIRLTPLLDPALTRGLLVSLRVGLPPGGGSTFLTFELYPPLTKGAL